MNGRNIGILLFLLWWIPLSLHAEQIRSDRYTLSSLEAAPSQKDPLSAIVETEYPSQVGTVGEAVEYLLQRSGYKHLLTESIVEALELPLPRNHRRMGPLDLRTALKTLLGPNWELQENSTVRLVWFQLAEAPGTLSPPPPAIVAAAVPEEAEPTAEEQQKEWSLHPELTLQHNLQTWADQAEWALQWNSRHDYEIFHQSSYQGTFFDAVSAVLKHYEDAPVPLIANFYSGNSVLVIEPYHSNSVTP